MMNSRKLMAAAMRRQQTERIPTMPQICKDVAIRIYADREGTDWKKGYGECAEHPEREYEYVIRLAKEVGCDGVRLFVKDEPRKVVSVGDELIVTDACGKQRLGKIDMHGGGRFVPDKCCGPVETIAEAKKRLDEMVEVFSDEKMAMLTEYRRQVPELFVASAPLGFTMNTYNVLRGREQAMIDFFERPDFVKAVIEIQVEAAIQQSEILLETGIDALYIGDPSASASIISPKHFEQFCFPAYERFCRYFESKDILIYLHICGNSKPILEMMAETGVEAIEPLDPLGGVSVAEAKKLVGQKVALMGGVNTLTLAQGTVEQVKNEAAVKCREGGPEGYILASGDMIPADTPFENLRAMVEVAKESLWR